MNNIRSIWDETKTDPIDKNEAITPLAILNTQKDAINADVKKTNILGLVLTITVSENDTVKEVKHVLYLMPTNGNDYNYRFIEIVQHIDALYPIKVYAYQAGNTNFGTCNSNEEFYTTLEKIFNDQRLRIVFDQLKSIGNTIEDARKNW